MDRERLGTPVLQGYVGLLDIPEFLDILNGCTCTSVIACSCCYKVLGILLLICICIGAVCDRMLRNKEAFTLDCSLSLIPKS